ncbi:MAG: hypothetical protein J6P31_07065 [Oscillospiraceae bacterium]|nr:hypothetical protein [Oscillospiraceae bacterium]
MKRLILICLIGAVAAGLAGCTGQTKYKVDYSGRKSSYQGAKNAYPAGAKVVLYYDTIATDTDYSFLLDGEGVDFTYEDGKGFRIEFTMPAHDVKLECSSRNSMEYVPIPSETPAVLTFESFDGGGPEYEITMTAPDLLEVEKEIRYLSENHEEVDGASYEVIFTLTGQQPGMTTVTVRGGSSIVPYTTWVYRADVDFFLNVQLTLIREEEE